MSTMTESRPQPAVDEIRRTAEARLRELQPLVEEVEQLHGVLAALDRANSQDPGGAPAPPRATPRTRTRSTNAERAVPRARRGTRPGTDGRAPQGSNKQLILQLVTEQPGIGAPEIARITGIKRTIVATTMSRLKRTGELREDEHGIVHVAPDVTILPSADNAR
jgi:hypothetical protein